MVGFTFACDRLSINQAFATFFGNDASVSLGSAFSAERSNTLNYAIGCCVAKLRRGECLCVANVDYEKRVIEHFPYNTSVYYALFNQLIAYNMYGN